MSLRLVPFKQVRLENARKVIARLLGTEAVQAVCIPGGGGGERKLSYSAGFFEPNQHRGFSPVANPRWSTCLRTGGHWPPESAAILSTSLSHRSKSLLDLKGKRLRGLLWYWDQLRELQRLGVPAAKNHARDSLGFEVESEASELGNQGTTCRCLSVCAGSAECGDSKSPCHLQ